MNHELLDWNRPLLFLATDYFCKRFTVDGRLDMSRVTLALPGRRAINRLEELLAERAERMSDPAWYPPEFITLGTLPEKFYELAKPVADDLTQRFAWLDAIDRLGEEDAEQLARLLPHPPTKEDLDARLALGKIFALLHRELAADDLDFNRVAELCEKRRLRDEALRWQTLAELQRRYLERLDGLGVWDVQSARLFAIHHQQPEEFEWIYRDFEDNERKIFLVGLVDMNRAQKAILKKFEKFVTPLVFAPPEFADRFDEFGCLLPDAWAEAPIRLDEEQIAVVQRPEDQADAVLRSLAELKGQFAADQIVVGVPDPQVIPFLQQRFEQAGIESRHFEGTPTRRTAVYRFLEVLGAFYESRLRSQGFSAFAELVRHPDVETWLWQGMEDSVDLLSELDNYHTLFLPETIGDDWKPYINEANPKHGKSFDSLRSVWNRLKELCGFDVTKTEALTDRLTPTVQTQRLESILERLYGSSEERFVVEARKQVRSACQTLCELPAELVPDLTLPETIRMVLMQLESSNIPPHDMPGAIEMIGWLEIVMDDAPAAFVTGMNDGFVPSFLTSDMFLPDKVRRDLDIEDNRRRYARDAYALSAILGFRTEGHARFIGGRLSVDGDPMLPSRLFFAADDETVARRVLNFFREQEDSRPIRLKGTVQPGCEKEFSFKIPDLELPEEPPEVMRVTEFADYLRCPYRYYLRHRLKLDNLSDDEEELNAGGFGTLVHGAIEKFSRSVLKDSDSADEIYGFLADSMQRYSVDRYGDHPRPAISIQMERALNRLAAFADWQADWRKKGYKIRDVEYPFDERACGGNIYLDVDGREMYLRGRIDRIDVEEATGKLVVLDFKTSDSAADPQKTHRQRNPEGFWQWVDFQLPLYHYILRRAGEKGDISLGYVTLPKDVSKTAMKPAPWDSGDIDEAIEQARTIVRRIRSNDFKPVDPPPKYSEAFAAICLDGVIR